LQVKSKTKDFETVGKLRIVEIQKTVEENPTVKTFSFRDDLCSKAVSGQFVMVWIPNVDEIPMSLSAIGDYCAFTVSKVGEATNALHKTKIGDLIGIRGPFGKGFSYTKGDTLVVGGGFGLAPLAVLAENLVEQSANVTFLLGAKTRTALFFLERIKKACKDVVVAAEDGSIGVKGLITQYAEEEMAKKRFDMIYSCGPELMMVKMLSLAEKHKMSLQMSLERLMRCAVGLCGSCVIGTYRVCKDGPVFSDKQLNEVKDEFGKFKRDFDGRKIAISK